MNKIRPYLVDALCYIVGSFLFALSVNLFTAPNNIAPGGLTGIATLLNHLFGTPIGGMTVLMNLPLLIAAWIKLGRSFAIRTIFTTFLSSAMIDVTALFVPPVVTEERLLAALFGGALGGVGLSLVFMRGATTGGSEVIARLLERRFRHLRIGVLIFAVDAVVITASVFVYGELVSALYATVTVFVTSIVIDKLIYGSSTAKLLLIVTGKGEDIKQEVLKTLGHGVTELAARGGYTDQSRKLLLCAVRRTDVYLMRRVIAKQDPEAFTMIVTADSVHGEGFQESDVN